MKIRGVSFEENENNAMGLSFYNLSHRFGYQSPNWPYFEDVKIERIHYMAKSGVLSQRITTSMHNTTHIDAPAHVVQGTPFIDEVPLPHFFGSGIVISIPKKKWEQITYDDLEKAAGKVVRPRDVVIVNTGWQRSTRIAKTMREAVIAVRPLGDFAGQKVVGLARPALRHRRVALALHSRPGDRKDGAGNARAIHGPKPRLAEIGEAGQDAARHLRVNVADRRPPVVFVTGCQEMLFKRNLADHAFLVSPHASGV